MNDSSTVTATRTRIAPPPVDRITLDMSSRRGDTALILRALETEGVVAPCGQIGSEIRGGITFVNYYTD